MNLFYLPLPWKNRQILNWFSLYDQVLPAYGVNLRPRDNEFYHLFSSMYGGYHSCNKFLIYTVCSYPTWLIIKHKIDLGIDWRKLIFFLNQLKCWFSWVYKKCSKMKCSFVNFQGTFSRRKVVDVLQKMWLTIIIFTGRIEVKQKAR